MRRLRLVRSTSPAWAGRSRPYDEPLSLLFDDELFARAIQMLSKRLVRLFAPTFPGRAEALLAVVARWGATEYCTYMHDPRLIPEKQRLWLYRFARACCAETHERRLPADVELERLCEALAGRLRVAILDELFFGPAAAAGERRS